MKCEVSLSVRCSWGPVHHFETTRVKLNKEVRKLLMEYSYRSKPFDEEGKPIKICRRKMLREGREREMFESTEQHVCDQARAIRKNSWLSELELNPRVNFVGSKM